MQKVPFNFCFKQEAGSTVHKLYIYDDVSQYGQWNWNTWEYEESETSAKYFREQLEAIPETDSIELYINSNGGSVKEGIAIMNQLKRHKAHKTGYVDGVAYSIAFMILQACDTRIMGEGTSGLIHEMWVSTYGNAAQLRKTADDLEILMESNRQILLERSTLTEQQIIDMMAEETFLTPKQCLEYGFCDKIEGVQQEEPEEPEEPEEKITAQQLQKAQKEILQLRQQLAESNSLRKELAELQETIKEPKQEPKKTLAQLFAGAAAVNYKKGEKIK